MGYGASQLSLSVAQSMSTESDNMKTLSIALKGLLRDKGRQSYREQLISQCVNELARIARHIKLLQAQWETLPQKTVTINAHKRALTATGTHLYRARWRFKTIKGLPDATGRYFTSAKIDEVSLLRRGLEQEMHGDYIWEQFLVFDMVMRNLATQSVTIANVLREVATYDENGATTNAFEQHHYTAASTLMDKITAMDATNNIESINQTQ